MQESSSSLFGHARFRVSLALMVLAAALLVTGCGGHTRAVAPTPTPTPGITAAQIRIGDAPVDSVIAFEVTFTSPLVVSMSGGQSANLTLQNNRWELSHMGAKMEPFFISGVPQGSITSVQATLTNPEVTYLTGTGPQTFSGSGSQTVTVNLNPPLVIGATPSIVTLDINIASTLTFDQTGAVTAINFSASSFTFASKAIAAEAQQQDEDGEMEGVTGKVIAVNGSSFTLDAGQGGAELNFITDNSTQFEGVTLSTLLNKIVKVEGHTRPDNTVYAKEVEALESDTGAELEGMVTALNLASTFEFLLQDGMGNGVDTSKVGEAFTVEISNSTVFNVDYGKCDTGGLPTLTFDSAHFSPGQRIEVELPAALGAAGSTTPVADQIKLEQQALTGTVSGFTAGNNGTATFTLNLPAESYLTALSGATSVNVFLQAGTDKKVTTIADGDTVRVRGLLFVSGSAPANTKVSAMGVAVGAPRTFAMVARRVTAP